MSSPERSVPKKADVVIAGKHITGYRFDNFIALPPNTDVAVDDTVKVDEVLCKVTGAVRDCVNSEVKQINLYTAPIEQ